MLVCETTNKIPICIPILMNVVSLNLLCRTHHHLPKIKFATLDVTQFDHEHNSHWAPVQYTASL